VTHFHNSCSGPGSASKGVLLLLLAGAVLLGTERGALSGEHHKDALAWLQSGEDASSSLPPKAVVPLLLIPRASQAELIFSPDRTSFAYYHLAPADSKDKDDRICIGRVAETSREAKKADKGRRRFKVVEMQAVYERKSNKKPAPLGVLWAPDSDGLVVKLGSCRSGMGMWVKHDLAQKKLALTDKALEEIVSRFDPSKHAKPRTDMPTPVWTLGGKFFMSPLAATKKGYRKFFTNPQSGPVEHSARIPWAGRKPYRIATESFGAGKDGNPWRIHVFDGKRHLGSAAVAIPPLLGGRIILQHKEGHLLLKVSTWTKPELNRPKDGKAAGPKKNAQPVVLSFSVGKYKLDRALDLGQGAVVLQVRNKMAKKWLLVDTTALTEQARSAGKRVKPAVKENF
jgi:hypothetical protein